MDLNDSGLTLKYLMRAFRYLWTESEIRKLRFDITLFIYNLVKFCTYRIYNLVRSVEHLHVCHTNAIYFNLGCVKGLMS